jgi:hypothetical protein
MEAVGSRFHVLLAQTHFRLKRGCSVPFSCFALLESFPAVPRASSPVFMFCTPGLIFGGTAGIGSHFHVLRSWTHFQRYRGRRVAVRPFFARSAPLWRWVVEERHRDLSQTCIYLVSVEFTAHTHWDAHSAGFLNWDPFRFRWAQAPTVNYPGLLSSRHIWISKGGVNTITK